MKRKQFLISVLLLTLLAGLISIALKTNQERGKVQMKDAKGEDAWQRWWDARLAAIESVLGKSDHVVGHAATPFNFGGPDTGARADILYFRRHIPGVVYTTADLIGCDELGCKEQPSNRQGNYELMVCHRKDEEWGPTRISWLAHYTLQSTLNPGETMDFGSAMPQNSTIAALLFFDYARFKVRGRDAGLLLCMGITPDELKACREGRRKELENALKEAGAYPYTDLFRESVLKSDRK
jgi:hypothetical protein